MSVDAKAVLAAVGYNFRRLIAWLKLLFCLVWALVQLEPRRANRTFPT
jgi:hypothetical protein